MRRRLFVFFILILFFGVAATGYLSYSFTKELIVNNTIENLKSETKLAEGYFDNISKNIDFDALAHRIKERTGKRATIVRDDGIVIGESEMKSSAMENHLNRPEIRDALLKGWGISTRLSDTQKTNVCYYAERYTVNGRTYVLRLSVQFDSILRMQLKHLRAILFAILGGIIICTILVYIYINTFIYS
jgi:two-component system phosphate regulon sensor histidine kinase PhoR